MRFCAFRKDHAGIGRLVLLGTLAVGLMAVSGHAMAAVGSTSSPDSLTGLFNNWMNLMQIAKKLASELFMAIGFVLFGMGLWMFYKDTKEPGRGHAKNGTIALVIGICLMVVTTLVSYTGQSFFGNGQQAKQNVMAGSTATQY